MTANGHSESFRLAGDSAHVRELLRERAWRLQAARARPPAGELSVLAFDAGGDRFALDIAFISHVAEAGRICPLPGAPVFLRGVANVRAEVLPVIDLRELLGLPRRPYPQEDQLIVGHYEDRRPAFLTDGCGAIRRLREEECGKVPATFPAKTKSLARFFTTDGLLVLDGEALLGGDATLIHL